MFRERKSSADESRARRRLGIVAAAIAFVVGGGLAIAQSLPAVGRAAGVGCADVPTGEACASGLCLSAHPFPDVCSSYCETDIECLAGWSCVTMREPTGADVKYCRPQRT